VPVAVKLRRELVEGTSGIKYTSSKVGVVRLLLLSGLRVNPNTGGFRVVGVIVPLSWQSGAA
jgi:hypothetical protein